MDVMTNRAAAYSPERGGIAVEETAYGFSVVVHRPADTDEPAKRVAQAHADAVIARVKKLSCSAKQKKELIDAICTQ